MDTDNLIMDNLQTAANQKGRMRNRLRKYNPNTVEWQDEGKKKKKPSLTSDAGILQSRQYIMSYRIQ